MRSLSTEPGAIRYIQTGKPNQNAYIKRFNRTYREELQNQYLFAGLDDVREVACWWMLEYNEARPPEFFGRLHTGGSPTKSHRELYFWTYRLDGGAYACAAPT